MTSELKTALPDRVCIWDADKSDPTSTRGWTISFQENHPDIYVRASDVTRAVPDVPELVIVGYANMNDEGGLEYAYSTRSEARKTPLVLYPQAAAVIAAKDSELALKDTGLKIAMSKIAALEAKLAQIEKPEACGSLARTNLNNVDVVLFKPFNSDFHVKDGMGVYTNPVASDAEIERLRAALEFYADTSKYPAPLTGGMGALWADCGEIARAALNPSEPRT